VHERHRGEGTALNGPDATRLTVRGREAVDGVEARLGGRLVGQVPVLQQVGGDALGVVARIERAEDDHGGRRVGDVFLPVGDRLESVQVVATDDEELPRLKVERGRRVTHVLEEVVQGFVVDLGIGVLVNGSPRPNDVVELHRGTVGPDGQEPTGAGEFGRLWVDTASLAT